METEIVYAVALVLQQVSETAFHLFGGPTKMLMEECIELAMQVNMDNSHPLIVSCTPFIEQAITQ